MTVSEMIAKLLELPQDAKLVSEIDDDLYEIDPVIWKSGPNPIIMRPKLDAYTSESAVYWIG